MKKIIFSLFAALLTVSAYGWGTLGHKTVIAIAQRHISDKAKEGIARYFDYNIQEDAVWMDKHRKDEPIAYTTAWHVYNVDENHRYDPSPRACKGDCIKGLHDAIWCLQDYKNLSDSAVVMNVRMLIHFAGDMHCPVHSYFPGPRNFWKCRIESINWSGSFHGLYDTIPELLYPGVAPDDLAEQLDNCSEEQIRQIQEGTLEDWAKSSADVNAAIYEINAPLTENLDPQTVEKSRSIVDTELRNAGYRLARLLEEIFG